MLIAAGRYFVLHAARQAGKTKSWDERIWQEDRIVDGKTIHCYGA